MEGSNPVKYIKGSYIQLPNKKEALKLRGANLNVYAAICGYANDEGQCFPSYSKMAEDTGYSKRVCMRAVDELVELGFLTLEKRDRENGSHSSNLYQIQLFTSPSDVHDTTLVSHKTLPSDVHDTTLVSHKTLPSDVHDTPITKPINNTLDKSNVGQVELFEKLALAIKQPKAKALPSRLAKLKTRLKTWTEQDLLKAAANLAADDWMMGKNDRQTRYGTMDYLLRSDENVEKWIDKTPVKNNRLRSI